MTQDRVGGDDRAQAPIRWFHPDAPTVFLVGLWAAGVIVALFVPALIVAPTAKHPPTSSVWTAFGLTVVGTVVMVLAAGGLWRRSKDPAVLVMGIVPAVVCIAGGLILAATKLA
jgi:hypothetical protein